MATEAGSAFARFYLDLRGLRQDAEEARNIMRALRSDLAAQMHIPISFTTDMGELNAFIQGIRAHIAKEFSTEIEQPVVTRRRGGRGGGAAAAGPDPDAAAAAAGRPTGVAPLTGTALEAALQQQIDGLRRDAAARQVIARKLFEEEDALEEEVDALKERARLIRAAGRYIGPGADLPEPGRMKRETEEARAALGPTVDVSEAAQDAAASAAREATERLEAKTRERTAVNDRAIDLEMRANALQDQLNDITEQRIAAETQAAQEAARQRARARRVYAQPDPTAAVATSQPLPQTNVPATNLPQVNVPATDAATQAALNQAAANQTNAASINQVAGATQNLVTVIEKETAAKARAAEASRDYTEAIRLNRELVAAAEQRGDTARAANLEAHIANLERRGAALESDRALSRARLEASTGDYAAALERLFNRLQQLTRGSDEAIRIEQAFQDILKQGTRDAYQFADALTSLAAATGGPGAALAQVQTNIQETPAADIERQIALHKQQAKLIDEVTAEFTAEQQQLMKNAVASGDFATAIATVDARLQNFNMTVKEELALQGLRENLVRQATTAEVQADIVQAKRLAGSAEYAKALNILHAQLTTLTQDSADYLAVEKALIQVTDQMVTAEQRHEDALVQTALTARDLTAALAANRAAQAQTDPSDPAHQGRRDQLAKQEADIQRRFADEAIRRERSELQLLVQQGKMADAIALVDNALTRSLPGQTAHNNLLRQRTRIIQEVEDETRQMALTAIRDAKNTGDTTLAHERLNRELERQRVLAKEYGGLGGGQIAPLGQARRLVGTVGPGAETTADIDRLLAMRTQIGAKEEQIQRRAADAAVKRQRSEIQLLVQQNKIAEAIRIVDAALTQALPHDTSYNQLMRERTRILQEAEEETRQMARASIADAKAKGDQALAMKRVNDELERQRTLSRDYGGLGGGRIVPLGQPRRLVGTEGTAPETTAEIDRLLAVQRQVANMPTFMSRAGAAFTRFLGPLALVTSAYEVLHAAQRQVIEGFRDLEQVTLTTRTMGALFNSIDRGSRVMEEAIQFGREYGFTQREMAEAANDAAIILQTSNLRTEKAFEILLRLQTRAPNQNIQAAVRSIAELQAGQLQSIERVFNIPQRMAQAMSDAIKAGEEPLEVLDDTLNKLGQTAAVLGARQDGLTRSFNDVRTAAADARVEFAKNSQEEVQHGAELLSDVLEWLATALHNARINEKNLDTAMREGASAVDIFRIAWEEFQATFGGQRIELQQTAEAVISLRDAMKQAPGFKEFFAPDTVKETDKQLTGLGDRIGVVFSRLEQDQINTAQAVEQLAAAREKVNDQDRDATEGIRIVAQARARANGDYERELDLLYQGARLLMNTLDEDPRVGDKVGADFDYVLRRAKEIDDLHPTIDVEVRMKQANLLETFYTNIAQQAIRANQQITDENRRFTDELADLHAQRAENTRDYIRSVNETTSEFNKQRRRENQDFERDMALAASEFRRQQAQSRAEFGEQQARSAADFARGQAREDEDRARALARTARDRRQQDEREEREHQRSILRAQEEFTRERLRSEEDFQDEYRGLLATGRRAEAEVALFRFRRDQRREGEDFGRSQADAEQQRRETIEERNRQRAQEDADEREDFEYRRRQANEDFARQQAQAAADFEKQYQQREVEFARQQQQQRDNLAYQQARADEDHAETLRKMKAAYKQQQDELDTSLDNAREAHKQNIKDINADYVQYVLDQEKIMQDGNAKLFAVEALKAAGIADKEAEAIVALEFAMSEYDRVLKEGEGVFAQTGTEAGIAYVEGLAKAILDSLRNVKPFIPPPGFYDPPTYGQPGTGTGVGGGMGSYSAGARIGPQYVIRNRNTADDPRPGNAATAAAFGSGAYVNDTFDAARPGTTGTHQGLDVIMDAGAPVHAPVELFIDGFGPDQFTERGKTIYATDRQGRKWLIAHFRNTTVRKGVWMPKGAVIGYIDAEYRHVHVQLKNTAGVIIDPSQAIEEAAGYGAPAGGAAGSYEAPGGGAAANAATGQDLSVLVGPASAVGVSAKDIARLQAALQIIVEPPDRTVNVAVTIPPIVMDGERVGGLAAPYAYDMVVEDFRVAVSVTEASQVPTLKQASFRGVR